MSLLPTLLQATAIEPLPEAADAASTAAASPAAHDGGLNYLQLILDASLPVQAVMALLLLASVASWIIIFRKKRVLDRAQKEADLFEERFWAGGDLGRLYNEAAARKQDISGLEAIFEGGLREFNRVRQRRGIGFGTARP